MAIKYTRPDPPDAQRSRGDGSRVRMLRYSAAPPTRRALTWIIAGTALAVTLMMIASELTSQPPQTEYEWFEGTVISNEAQVLRVEIAGRDADPPGTYDISVEGHPKLRSVEPGDTLRIQVETDESGGVARIIRVEAAQAGGTAPSPPE